MRSFAARSGFLQESRADTDRDADTVGLEDEEMFADLLAERLTQGGCSIERRLGQDNGKLLAARNVQTPRRAEYALAPPARAL